MITRTVPRVVVRAVARVVSIPFYIVAALTGTGAILTADDGTTALTADDGATSLTDF